MSPPDGLIGVARTWNYHWQRRRQSNRERITLELRVDAFNTLNHTEFNNLDNNTQDIGSAF
jgi:hypothetical protein